MNGIPSSKATSNQTNASPLRVIFFGMTGAFSIMPLLTLLDARTTPRIEVRAVVMPTLGAVPTLRLLRTGADDPHPPFVRLDRYEGIRAIGAHQRPILPMAAPAAPVANQAAQQKRGLPTNTPPRNILQLATERGLPVFEVARLDDPRTLDALAEFAPDLICVACFSRRLPPALLRLPRLGCLNVHPSLLPANRGPDPLFWTFHQGEATTGVTVHLMDEGLDTGPIVLQKSVVVEEGIDEMTLETVLKWGTAMLLVQAVTGLATGSLHPRPQDNAQATTYSWPTEDDYVIHASEWSAERAYRFARGVSRRAPDITLVAEDGARFILVEAHSYRRESSVNDTPWSLTDDSLTLRCNPGVLYAQVIPENGEEMR